MPLLTIPVAFGLTLLATPLLRAAAGRVGLLDRPNERSSHTAVTPRTGGLGLLLGVGGALAVTRPAGLDRPELGALVGGGLLVALIGLVDDRYRLPPWPRLVCHVLAATALVLSVRGLDRLPLPAPLDLPLGPLGPALAVLWVVTVVNFFNFMDGIDGLAGVQALVTAGVLAWALRDGNPAAASVAAALAAAVAAFLLFNWAPASVFLGDAGSGFIGYTLASLPLLAPEDVRSGAVGLTGASLFLFLADASTCLLRRALRGERWYEAHREHLYQRWVRGGAGHARVAALLGLAMMVTTLAGAVAWRTGRAFAAWGALLSGTLLTLAELAHVRRLERRAAARR